MVETFWDESRRQAIIVLTPNRSLSWAANLHVLASLAALSFFIAAAFLIRGYWLILPFTTIELSALFVCLYYLTRRAQQQEVITLDQDRVRLERGRRRPETVREYHRAWARFVVSDARSRPHITLQSAGRTDPVGEFLSDRDLRELIVHLRQFIHRLSEPAHMLAPATSTANPDNLA